LGDAEEGGFVLLGSLFLEILFTTDFDHKIGSEVEHKLVFTKERELWELKEWCDTLLIIEYGGTFRYEIHLIKFLTMGDDSLSGLIDTAIHVDDQLMLETDVSVQEEVIKLVLEGFEKRFRNLVLD